MSEIKSLFQASNNQLMVFALFSLESVFMFSIYTLIPCVIEMSSAAFLNVNLLAADFYSVLFGILIKNFKVIISLNISYNIFIFSPNTISIFFKLHFLYFIGFACIMIGTILYATPLRFKRRSRVNVDVDQTTNSPPIYIN